MPQKRTPRVFHGTRHAYQETTRHHAITRAFIMPLTRSLAASIDIPRLRADRPPGWAFADTDVDAWALVHAAIPRHSP